MRHRGHHLRHRRHGPCGGAHGAKEFERFVGTVRKNKPDFQEGCAKLLVQVPEQHRAVIAERIDNYRENCTVIKKIRTCASMKPLFGELEN